MAIIRCPSCSAANRVVPIARGTPRCPRCKSALPWVVDASASTFAGETAASVPVVVDFWAGWCGPCKRFAPVYEEASERYSEITFGKVDTEAQVEIAQAFGISSIPTVMAVRDGVVLYSEPGALPAAALEDLIGQVNALDMDDVRRRIAEQEGSAAEG